MHGQESSFDAKSQLVPMRVAQHARNRPQTTVYTFLGDDGESSEGVTFEVLDRSARAVAALLQENECLGRPVLLLLPPGRIYTEALFGCFYAGAVAVPTYPPLSTGHAGRVEALTRDCAPEIALVDAATDKLRANIVAKCPSLDALRWIVVDELPEALSRVYSTKRSLQTSDLAFIQYTSGSTGTPKGVAINHGNLASNLDVIYAAFAAAPGDRQLSWLPPFHDMGLMSLLGPAALGHESVQASPSWFIRRPERWLRALSKYQITHSGAPNFAYEMVARRAHALADERLDLSRWRVAFTGAEPVQLGTCERFAQAFARHEFDAKSFLPCYGMAEATLMISAEVPGKGCRGVALDRAAFQGDRVKLAVASSQDVVHVASCGPVQGNARLKIVRPESKVECAADEIGEIWFSGDSVATRYWNAAELSAQQLEARVATEPQESAVRYLRTGDKGFVLDGNVYVAGRIKDMIIIRGRNHYPVDLEATVQEVGGAACGTAAVVAIEAEAEQRLLVVVEAGETKTTAAELGPRIAQALFEYHGVSLAELCLVRRNSLPRTSSGKVQRYAVRESYLVQKLEVSNAWHSARVEALR